MLLSSDSGCVQHFDSHKALSDVFPDNEGVGCASRLRSEKEARKHMQRRKKRKRDKASGGDAQQNGAAAPEADAAGYAVMASDLLAPLQVIRWLLMNALRAPFREELCHATPSVIMPFVWRADVKLP